MNFYKISKFFNATKQFFIKRSYNKHANGASYFHYIGKDPLVYRTVGQQLDLSAREFDNEAVVSCHEGKRLTFPQLLPEINRISAGYMKLGLKPGDFIAIWGPNSINWYLSMLAAARAGLISVVINPAYQAAEIEYCLNKVKCKAIWAPESHKNQNYYEILKSIAPELSDSVDGKLKSQQLPYLKNVVIESNTQLKGVLNFMDFQNLSSPEDIAQINHMQDKLKPDAPCNVQFTSGTTGKPKAAVLSHFSIVNNGFHIGKRNELAGERICVQNPFFHAYGVVITISASLAHGATVVLPSASYSPKHSLQTIIEEKCTVIHGTPTMYVDLVNVQKELKLPLSNVKKAITGGAVCAPQLFLDIKQVLNVQEVRSVFGLTESTAVIFQSRNGDSEDKVLNTVGHVQDHVEVKVIDDKGNIVPFGVAGELCVRGYSNMLEYYEDEQKTKETIGRDRWLKTGDQFVLQANGYGKIVGRLKEMVIRGGENIFPKEIEDFLHTHPDIIETHVIGVPDERLGEELCAFMRLRQDASVSHDDLKHFSKGKIAPFKVPRYVVAVDSFPRTTSGKIQKFKLKEIFLKNHTV